MSASWWMLSQHMCVSIYWDFSHRAQNDWKGMLRDTNMMGFWILMLVCWNAPCGPRWQQLLEAWQAMHRVFPDGDCPLYLERVQDILEERGGIAAVSDGPGDVSERLWADLSGDPPFSVGAPKANLNRFFSTVAKARSSMSRWSTELLNYEFLALEEGGLSGKKLQGIVVKSSREKDETERATTGGSRPQVCDAAMKSACSNAVVVGVAMLGEREHKDFVSIILVAGEPTERWLRTQSARLRDVQSSESWMVKQLGGGGVHGTCAIDLGHVRQGWRRAA